ncbi:MAG: glycosyltransferase family 4 protein [Bacteroidales bacterium]|jgi:glycosyltransferase involved in cell wall biosynthesis|nr:glycosyltransferase family 4 protein [Bacteroidales bacterium]
MKVLMFGWEYPPHITGGLGTACFGLTKAMVKQGDEVIFIVPKMYGDELFGGARLVNASDIVVNLSEDFYKQYWHNLSYVEINSTLIPYIGLEDYFNVINQRSLNGEGRITNFSEKKYEFSGKYGKTLLQEVERYALVGAQIAKNYQYDIIHAHDWLTYKAGVMAKKVSGKKLVIHVHATEFDRSGDNINQQVYDIERYGMDEADHIVCVSNFTRNIVINRYNQNPDKVSTIYNGANSLLSYDLPIEKTIKEKVVTFLGRITFQKGPDYFVEAAHKVLKYENNVRFVMAGSGDMLNRMIALVAKKRISKNFHFTGFLNSDEVKKLYALSDIYVMPSVSEPFGISPLEAIGSNLPVIISKQSGVSEVLKYAIKVDFWDIDAMANAIYCLINYDALSKMFISNGKTEVENIKWETSAKELRNLYYTLLK